MRWARVLLLGLLVAGAAAACVDNKDGCLTCSSDGTSCTECDSNYSLSGGACVKCSGGASDSGVRCTQCDANDPGICLRCEATSSDVGAYIDSSGACRACPSGCTSCKDGDGSCKDGDTQSGGKRRKSERGASCPERCADCDSKGKCDECEEGWLLDESGACVQCGDSCIRCKPSSSGGTKCVECASGFAPVRGGCQGCSSPACTSCPDGPAQCAECRDGFVAYGGGCTKCSIGSCLRCDSADPNRCLECSGSLGADSSGKCVEGKVEHCKSVDPGNANNCLRCADGYIEVPDDASGATTCQQAPASPASQKLRLRRL